jgi:hypothetical protein
MTPYIDVGFLSTLLIKTPGRKLAWRNLQKFDPPHALNLLHHLQIENLLARCQLDADDGIKATGLEGARLWRFYAQEGVFQVRSAGWDAAFRAAISWTQTLTQDVPFLLILHAALGAESGATHFLSFDPRARQFARRAGLKLLPESL